MLLSSSTGPCLDGGSWRGSHFSRGYWQAQNCKLHTCQPSCSPCLLHSTMKSARGCAFKKRAQSLAQLWPCSLLARLQSHLLCDSAQSVSSGQVLPFLLPACAPMCIGVTACSDRSAVVSCSNSSKLVHTGPACLSDTSTTAGEHQGFGDYERRRSSCRTWQRMPRKAAGSWKLGRCHAGGTLPLSCCTCVARPSSQGPISGWPAAQAAGTCSTCVVLNGG